MTDQNHLNAKRVLVMGASSGLGRAVGSRLAGQGARVAFAARRADAVQDAAAASGGDAIGVTCDIRDAAACETAVAEVVDRFGGLDALVHCAGVGALQPLATADAELWDHVLGTNVVGAAFSTRAALPHLEASGGRAIYFSSISASQTPPWPGLGTYIVSKAALDKLIDAFAVEHPGVSFTRITMGDSLGGDGPEATQFAAAWDMELLTELSTKWFELGYLSGTFVEVDELSKVVGMLLTTDVTVNSIVVRPGLGSPGIEGLLG